MFSHMYIYLKSKLEPFFIGVGFADMKPLCTIAIEISHVVSFIWLRYSPPFISSIFLLFVHYI